MLRKFILSFDRAGRSFAITSLLITIPSVILVFIALVTKYKSDGIQIQEMENVIFYTGAILILLALLKSAISDTSSIMYRENRIFCDTNIGSSCYNYTKLLCKNTKHAVFVAQNHRTLLSQHDFKDKIRYLLAKDETTRVTIIGTTYDLISQISVEAGSHYKESVKDLVTLRDSLSNDSQRKRFNVCFHQGAISLSAIITNPENANKGVIAFTPKWATDLEPANRMFCVIEGWEYPVLFNRMCGHLNIMMDPITSLSLDHVYEQLILRQPESKV